MGFEEMVDTLIADGHKTISLLSGKRRTDDENVFIEEYFVLNESGDIVARKIRTPGGYGWSMYDWQDIGRAMTLKLCSKGLILTTELKQKRTSY